MTQELINSLVTIALAIVSLATLAVLVSKSANTGSVISAASAGFAQDLSAATSPFSGGGLSLPSLGSSFGGGL